MDLTPKQQTSEAIRQAETILITTGQHPSVDQVSAVIALAMILRKFGKKVTAIVSDTAPQPIQLLDTASLDRALGGLRDFVIKLDVSKAEVDKLRYEVQDSKLQIFITPFKGSFAPSDVTYDYGEAHYECDLAIVLGVPTRARIDRVYEQNLSSFDQIPLVNLDFHRSNENYGAVNLIEPNASSLCEMLVALSESLQGGIIDAEIATALLMGIVASTDRFTASHTTSKSLTVAAQMMAAGARQQAVVKALYREGRGERNQGNDRAQGGERGGSRERDRGDRQGQSARGASQPATETRTAEPRPSETRSSETRSVEAENRQISAETRQSPAESRMSISQPTEARPADVRPAMERSVAETRPPQAAEVVTPVSQPRLDDTPVLVTAPMYADIAAPTDAAGMSRVTTTASAAPAPQPAPPVSAPTMPVAPAPMMPFMPSNDSDLIIQPGHIEFSELPADSAPVTQQIPADVLPMADFVAAADVLATPQPEALRPAPSERQPS